MVRTSSISAIAFVALLSLPTTGWAAKLIGNGGNVYVCPNMQAKVLLLDFAEARILRGKWIRITDPAVSHHSYHDKLASLIAKIDLRFPALAAKLREEIQYFESNSVKLEGLELDSVGDSLHKFRLEGCRVEQAINQAEPIFTDDPTFIISKKLWRELSELDKAGLVLHEILYRIGLKNGVEHSLGIRHLTSLLFHEYLDEISDRQWIEAFTVSRINYFEKNGVRLSLFDFRATCKITPGQASCEDSDSFKPSKVQYAANDSLAAIQYDYYNLLTFLTPATATYVSMDSSTLQYNEKNEPEISFFKGDISISPSPYGSGAIDDVGKILASGSLNPLTGWFCGKISRSRYAVGSNATADTEYCGFISDLVSKGIR